MKKQVGFYAGATAVICILALWHSVIAIAAVLLIASGVISIKWDKQSRSRDIRLKAVNNNFQMLASGVVLLLLAMVTSSASSDPLGRFLWVIAFAFSMTAAPVMIWQHFAKRNYNMCRSRINNTIRQTQRCNPFFEQRLVLGEVNSFDYKPSRGRVKQDSKQLKIAV